MSDQNKDNLETPKEIFLIKRDVGVWDWCDTESPSLGIDAGDVVKYVRAYTGPEEARQEDKKFRGGPLFVCDHCKGCTEAFEQVQIQFKQAQERIKELETESGQEAEFQRMNTQRHKVISENHVLRAGMEELKKELAGLKERLKEVGKLARKVDAGIESYIPPYEDVESYLELISQLTQIPEPPDTKPGKEKK